jgi:hypothetical protein
MTSVGTSDVSDLNLETLNSERPVYVDNTGRLLTVIEIIQKRQQLGNKQYKTYRDTQLQRVEPIGIPGHPKLPNPVVRDVNGYKQVTEECIRRGLSVLEGEDRVKIPLIEPCYVCPVLALSSDYDQLAMTLPALENGYYPLMSAGYPDVTSMSVVPEFRQKMENIQGWMSIYMTTQTLAEHYKRSGESYHLEGTIAILDRMKSCMQSSVFGNGSRRGQIGRMKTGYEVKLTCSEGGDYPGSMYYKCRSYSTFLKAMLLTNEYQTTNSFTFTQLVGSFAKDPNLVQETGEGASIAPFHVNAGSDPGFPWTGNPCPLKEETLFADMALASQMQVEFTDALRSQDLSEFEKRWDWIRVEKMKGKAEVYDMVKLTTRTRNIYPQSSCVNMILSCMMTPIKPVKRPLDVLNPTNSLRCHSLLKGGMHDVINHVYQQCDELGCGALYYADNLFFYKKKDESIVWSSIDAKQMEASHDRDVQVNMVRYFMHMANRVDPGPDIMNLTGGPVISAENGALCMWIISRITDNYIGVLGTTQIHGPGLPSGIRTTFDSNHTKSTIALHFMSRLSPYSLYIKDDGTTTDLFEQFAKGLAYPYKVENSSGGTSGRPGIVEMINDPYTAYKTGTAAELDLLGFDAINLRLGENVDLVVPVLSDERLVRSLCFRKNRLTRRQLSMSDLEALCVDYMTLIALYFMGAWRDPYSYAALAAMTSLTDDMKQYDNTETMTRAVSLASRVWASTLANDFDIAPQTVEVISEQVQQWMDGVVPPLWDVITVTNGELAGLLVKRELMKFEYRTSYAGGKPAQILNRPAVSSSRKMVTPARGDQRTAPKKKSAVAEWYSRKRPRPVQEVEDPGSSDSSDEDLLDIGTGPYIPSDQDLGR